MIRSARLLLRHAQAADLADVHAMLSHPAAMRYWSTPEHESLEQSRLWLEEMIAAGPDSADFLIEHQGRVIGKAGLWREPGVGYLLHPDFWGRGLACEAMQALVAHVFAGHGRETLTAECDPRNTPSLRLPERLGFEETGRAARTLQWRDEWCDSIYFGLHRADRARGEA